MKIFSQNNFEIFKPTNPRQSKYIQEKIFLRINLLFGFSKPQTQATMASPLEPQVADYYNQEPSAVRAIENMNEELHEIQEQLRVAKEQLREAELKNVAYHATFYVKKLLKQPLINALDDPTGAELAGLFVEEEFENLEDGNIQSIVDTIYEYCFSEDCECPQDLAFHIAICQFLHMKQIEEKSDIMFKQDYGGWFICGEDTLYNRYQEYDLSDQGDNPDDGEPMSPRSCVNEDIPYLIDQLVEKTYCRIIRMGDDKYLCSDFD